MGNEAGAVFSEISRFCVSSFRTLFSFISFFFIRDRFLHYGNFSPEG